MNVLAKVVAADEGDEIVTELEYVTVEVDPRDREGCAQPTQVVVDAERVELLVVLVPVAAEALKDGDSILQRGCQYMETGVLVRDELSVQEEERRIALLIGGHPELLWQQRFLRDVADPRLG